MTERMRAGLLSRLRRAVQRVEDQHRALREIRVELDRALASGSRDTIDTWFTRLRDGLVAHFELEEEVVFPAVHGLEPDTLPEIEQLERDHGRFLEKLDALIGRDRDAAPLVPADLKGLRERLAAHELREEHLLERALAGEE